MNKSKPIILSGQDEFHYFSASENNATMQNILVALKLALCSEYNFLLVSE